MIVARAVPGTSGLCPGPPAEVSPLAEVCLGHPTARTHGGSRILIKTQALLSPLPQTGASGQYLQTLPEVTGCVSRRPWSSGCPLRRLLVPRSVAPPHKAQHGTCHAIRHRTRAADHEVTGHVDPKRTEPSEPDQRHGLNTTKPWGSAGLTGRSERGGGAGLLLSRGGGRGGGGFGPKTWCTKNGLTRFSLL